MEHLLKDILQEEGRHSITIEQIQRRVAEHFDVRVGPIDKQAAPGQHRLSAAGGNVSCARTYQGVLK